MIAVVSTTYREADIVDLWLQHILAEGVDLVLVADKLSDDGTRQILERWQQDTGKVEWIDDTEPCHRQAYWTNRLAAEAHERGAEWILPADVDEFPYATVGGTIAASLAECPHEKLYMQVWPHLDWATRFAAPHRMPKVAYRWSPGAEVVMGSHEVSIYGGAYGVLDMRELQYRNFDHFCRKAADRNQTLEPAARARNDGSHHLRLEKMSQEELRREWELKLAQPSVHDPIPSHK